MERQKDREVHGEVKRQRRTWRGRKTEKELDIRKTDKDVERQKDREGHGVAERPRRTLRGRKTEKEMDRQKGIE